ncbi:MAG: peptide chain release factor 1 [Actinomycetota bacterium]
MQLPETRLKEIEARFEEVERQLADPAVGARPDDLKKLGKEHSELRDVVQMWRRYRSASDDLAEAKSMLAGSKGDERDYLQLEIQQQQATIDELGEKLVEALTPKDPNDERDVIVEIRAGAGGDEAGLFASELYRMFQRYAEERRWKVEELTSNESGIGGLKEVTFAVKGKGAYSRLKFEGGTHRVQRVPQTESSGRIHTSTVGVVVLPEADEVDVEIDPNDLKIDVYRASGPGGQSVNTTDSAVRIKHLPTGIEVACQDEKSQLQNKAKALRILRARLLQAEQERAAQAQAEARQAQVKTADRSEKIRTYNFHENRVTDHRIGLTSYRLQEVLNGELDEFIDALTAAQRHIEDDPES